MKGLHAVILLLSSVAAVAVNDLCVCNKAADPILIFDQDQEIIGDLKPNDCKVYEIQSKVDQGWLTIQFNGEKGFLRQGVGVTIDFCKDTQYEDSVLGTDMPVTQVQVVNNTVITNITYITNVTNIVNNNTTTISGNNTHVHLSHALLGNPKLCPPYVIQGAHKNGYVLTQHGHECYEVCSDRVGWNHALLLCKERGGHLVTIHNDKENTYLQNLLNHTYHHKVWIGLNDRANEEHFHWVTGEAVNYMHWKPHHRKSPDHNHEDCVVMLSNGYWDDVSCGVHASNGTQHNYAYICEYVAHSSAHIIG